MMNALSQTELQHLPHSPRTATTDLRDSKYVSVAFLFMDKHSYIALTLFHSDWIAISSFYKTTQINLD